MAKWVVGYNAESQQGWLAKLGLSSVYSSVIILISGIGILVLLYILKSILKSAVTAPFEHSIQQFNQSLKRFEKTVCGNFSSVDVKAISGSSGQRSDCIL